MKNEYFALLDLPSSATTSEIKTHYELLMRIYHPERFTNPEERRYAEYKCAELTKACQALLGSEDWVGSTCIVEPTLPRVEPMLIDWGLVNQGAYLATQVYIHARKGAKKPILLPDPAAPWVRVSPPEAVKVEGADRLLFGVMVHTEQLEIGKRYVSQVKVEVEQKSLFVFLLVHITQPSKFRAPLTSISTGNLDIPDIV